MAAEGARESPGGPSDPDRVGSKQGDSQGPQEQGSGEVGKNKSPQCPTTLSCLLVSAAALLLALSLGPGWVELGAQCCA